MMIMMVTSLGNEGDVRQFGLDTIPPVVKIHRKSTSFCIQDFFILGIHIQSAYDLSLWVQAKAGILKYLKSRASYTIIFHDTMSKNEKNHKSLQGLAESDYTSSASGTD